MIETWKDVKGYEGLYQVSNLGRVKSLSRKAVETKYTKNLFIKEKILVQTICSGGYPYITLFGDIDNRKKVRVHRLVAEAFIENSCNHTDVNHLDGNKKNNSIENLEWCNRSENISHAYRTMLRTPKTKISKEQAFAIKYKFLGFSQTRIGQIFGIHQITVSDIQTGKNWATI